MNEFFNPFASVANGDDGGRINDLIDVNINIPNNGEVLKYDSEQKKWINGIVSGGSGTTDYIDLLNKPKINNITLSGDKSLEDLGITNFLYDTIEGWNSKRDLISQKKVIYVYTNYQIIDNKNIPGIKIGDGSSYLIDMPFVSHITQQEREKWNNKVSVSIIGNNDTLLFSTS